MTRMRWAVAWAAILVAGSAVFGAPGKDYTGAIAALKNAAPA